MRMAIYNSQYSMRGEYYIDKSAPKDALFCQRCQCTLAEVLEESSNLGPDENETKEEEPSPEQILKQITDCFGETVGQAFQGGNN